MNFLAGILDFAANEKDFHAAKFWALELLESIDFPQNLAISAIPQLLKTSQGLPDERSTKVLWFSCRTMSEKLPG